MKRKTRRSIGSMWNKRYFTVELTSHGSGSTDYSLCYYHNEYDALKLDLPSREPGGWFYLSHITEIKLQQNQPSSVTKSKFPCAFLIRTKKRDLHVRAPNDRELRIWICGLEHA